MPFLHFLKFKTLLCTKAGSESPFSWPFNSGFFDHLTSSWGVYLTSFFTVITHIKMVVSFSKKARKWRMKKPQLFQNILSEECANHLPTYSQFLKFLLKIDCFNFLANLFATHKQRSILPTPLHSLYCINVIGKIILNLFCYVYCLMFYKNTKLSQ